MTCPQEIVKSHPPPYIITGANMVHVTRHSEVNDQSVLLYYNKLPEVKAFRLKEGRFLLFIV